MQSSTPLSLFLIVSLSLPCPGSGDGGLSTEGHGDKVECCSAVEIGNCCNYCHVDGKAFKYLLLTEEGRWGHLLLIAPSVNCKKKCQQVINFYLI